MKKIILTVLLLGLYTIKAIDTNNQSIELEKRIYQSYINHIAKLLVDSFCSSNKDCLRKIAHTFIDDLLNDGYSLEAIKTDVLKLLINFPPYVLQYVNDFFNDSFKTLPMDGLLRSLT